MIMSRSRNPSRADSPVRRGASPVRRGGLLFAVAVLLFAMVLLVCAVAVVMMIGHLLLLLLFASRVVGCRRHPLLPSPIRLPVVGL